MAEHTYRVKTELDPSGLQQLESRMDRIHAKAKAITQEMSRWGNSGGGGSQPSASARPAAASGGSGPVSGGGGSSTPRYNLDSISGVVQYDVDVLRPASQELAAGTSTRRKTSSERQQGFAQGFSEKVFGRQVHTTVPTRSPRTIAPPMNATNEQIDKWAMSLDTSRFTPQQRTDFAMMGANGDLRQFYQKHGQALGGPGTQSTTVAGTTGTSGGGQGNFAGAEMGAAFGSLAKKYLPWLGPAEAVHWGANQYSQGFGMWQESSQSFSQLAHSTQLASHNVEKFRREVSKAGAHFGESLQQSAASAQMLTQSFGAMSVNQTSNLVGSTASWALQSGLSYQQANQITATSANLGLTSGVGSVMSPQQYQHMMSNMVTMTGMQGRQGPLNTGMLDIYNTVAASNPTITNPQALSAMYAHLNASGIQGLQGMRGAALTQKAISAVISPNGITQNLLGAAIYSASGHKISNPIEWQKLWQQGPQTKIPGTNQTIGQALVSEINKQTPNGIDRNFLYAQSLGMTQTQAEAFIKNGGFNPKQPPSTTSPHNKPWYSMFDMTSIAKHMKQVEQSTLGAAVAPFNAAWNGIGQGGQTIATGAGAVLSVKYGKKILSKVASKGGKGLLARIFGGGGDAAAGAATDAGAATVADVAGTGAAVGGLEALGAGLDSTGIGAILGIPLGLAGAYISYRALHHHSSAASSNAQRAQTTVARQQSLSAATNAQLNNLTISNLRINQIERPGNTSSKTISGGSSPFRSTAMVPSNLSGPIGYINGNPIIGPAAPGGSTGGAANAPTSGYVGSSQKQFVQSMYGYGMTAAKDLGVPAKYQSQFARFAVAQWGHESKWGGSLAAKLNDNFAGIKPRGSGHSAGPDSKYAGYTSLGDFASGYAYYFQNNKRYANFINAAQHGASASALAQLLHQDHYASDTKYATEVSQAYNEIKNIKIHPSSIQQMSKAAQKQQAHHNAMALASAFNKGLVSSW